MPTVQLGNVAVREVVGADSDGTPIHRRYSGRSTTVIINYPIRAGAFTDTATRYHAGTSI